MIVFVIPVAPNRYELYYEHAAESTPEQEPESTGMVARLQRRFGELLRAAEAHGRRSETTEEPSSWMGRQQDRMLSWIAERIGEQRLLWNLRKQDRVVAVHPADQALDEILPHIRRALQRDFERHRFWLVVDTVGLIVSWPLTVIPGPNVLLFYFIFRVGGHWLSMRGAQRGRYTVEWASQPCEVLRGLRTALQTPEPARQQRVAEIAAMLHLQNLPAFVERQLAGTPGTP
jgi:hypothetical protein